MILRTQNISTGLKLGVSGIMRVKNDGCFIEACVESCIDALDELIIVWNDCTDNSADEIEKMRQRYPDKIKTYEYKYKVYSVGLTKEEYEYAKSLPKDSPHLLCNYYNFALSKVTCQYALKIDADQIYFTDKLKIWCNAYRKNGKAKITISVIIGCLLDTYFRIVNKLNLLTGKVLPLLPHSILSCVRFQYETYLKYLISKHDIKISLSGLNVFYDNQWYSTMGTINDEINILPPMNGTNDHCIFKVSKDTYYIPIVNKMYDKYRSEQYNIIELFVDHDSKYYNIGFFWFHLNSMREDTRKKVLQVKKKNPKAFRKVRLVQEIRRNDINKCPMADIGLKSLMQFQFAYDRDSILKYINILKRFSFK